MPPPPADGSEAAKADLEMFHAIHDHPSTERWEAALGDDLTVYDRFSEQLGLPIDRQHLPTLVRLLNRASADAFAVTAVAKTRYPRPRPYQTMQLKQVCGMPKAPAPDKGSVQGTSYPSGHAVVSWVAALVMTEVAPSSAQAIVGRAVSYGDSRVVCGLHFPADVEAGHKLASAVVAHLFEVPAFVHDLKCARRELDAVSKGAHAEDLAACAP
jgi:acid phosphatase (class A)